MPNPLVEPGTTTTPTDKPARVTTGTEYVVLKSSGDVDNGGFYTLPPTVHAATPAAAIQQKVGPSDKPEARYVAVPARSWKPVRAVVETVSKVKLEDA